jgi:alpha-L-fucosidase
MKKNFLVFIFLLLTQYVCGQNVQNIPDSVRMRWFNKAKFGIFLHWGVYSGHTTESWSFFTGEISQQDYIANGKKFTAANFNAARWADLFVKSGARYVVLTAMHADGVTLFDSKYSKTSVRNLTPCKRDLIKEYVEGMRKAGLKTGVYYSHVNWSDPDYMRLTQSLSADELRKRQKEKYSYFTLWDERSKSGYYNKKQFTPEEKVAWERFLNIHDSHILNELLTNYGKIDLLWFDFMYPNAGDFMWKEKELKENILKKNPEVIVNSRIGKYGDYVTAERSFPIIPPAGPWEYCQTLSDYWGYMVNDTIYKTSRQLIRVLAESISMGGNFLLDIGPKPDGTFDPEHEKRLLEIGAWINKHEEAVYETTRGLLPGHFYGPTALSPDKKVLYLYLFDDPKDDIILKGVRNKPVKITVVGHSDKLLRSQRFGGADWANVPGALSITVPRQLLDDNVTVIKIEFNEPIDIHREKGREITVNK